jgi:ribosome biogenesis protein Tsr3
LLEEKGIDMSKEKEIQEYYKAIRLACITAIKAGVPIKDINTQTHTLLNKLKKNDNLMTVDAYFEKYVNKFNDDMKQVDN